MKKLISALVATSMMIVPMFAMADATTAVEDTTAIVAGQTEGGVDIYDMTTEVAYTGVDVDFPDDFFTISIPDTWLDTEVTDELAEVGYYAYFISEDGTQYLGVQELAADEGTTPAADDIIAMLSGEDMGYTDVQPVVFGDYAFVAYNDPANSQSCYIMIDAAGTGYVNFVFGKTDAEDMAALVPQIMSSMTAMADDETEAADETEATEETEAAEESAEG